jgi:hypothetical protein
MVTVWSPDILRKDWLIVLSRIPHINTEFKSAQLRRAQADINQPRRLKDEIAGLTQLTLNNSQHTPLLISVLHTQQGDDALVPGGFVTYVLMTWCPGEPLFEHNYFSESGIERSSIHKAFADAWKYVISLLNKRTSLYSFLTKLP